MHFALYFYCWLKKKKKLWMCASHPGSTIGECVAVCWRSGKVHLSLVKNPPTKILHTGLRWAISLHFQLQPPNTAPGPFLSTVACTCAYCMVMYNALAQAAHALYIRDTEVYGWKISPLVTHIKCIFLNNGDVDGCVMNACSSLTVQVLVFIFTTLVTQIL